MSDPLQPSTARLYGFPASTWRGAAIKAAQALRVNPHNTAAAQQLRDAQGVLHEHAANVGGRASDLNATEDAGPQPSTLGGRVVAFGQGAGSGFTDEAAGAVATDPAAAATAYQRRLTQPFLADTATANEGRDQARQYLAAARANDPLGTTAADLLGGAAQMAVTGNVVNRAFPAVGRVAAAATAPAESFWGMLSQHAPAKLAATALGATGIGAATGARVAGETDGDAVARLRNGAIGFGVGAALGVPVTSGSIYATVLARTALKGLAPVFNALRGRAGSVAADATAPAIDNAIAPVASRADDAISREAALRAHIAKNMSLGGQSMTPSEVEAVVDAARRIPGSGLPRPVAPTSATVAPIDGPAGTVAVPQAAVAETPMPTPAGVEVPPFMRAPHVASTQAEAAALPNTMRPDGVLVRGQHGMIDATQTTTNEVPAATRAFAQMNGLPPAQIRQILLGLNPSEMEGVRAQAANALKYGWLRKDRAEMYAQMLGPLR